ncbi:hypothetical protein M378DRAFT_161819, partial [Amanita muscaria Koide BX008]
MLELDGGGVEEKCHIRSYVERGLVQPGDLPRVMHITHPGPVLIATAVKFNCEYKRNMSSI